MTASTPPAQPAPGPYHGGCDPAHQTCLRSVTMLLAGDRRAAWPACVHPLLAVLGREVRDALSSAGRPQLRLRAPQLVGTGTADPRVADRILDVVVERALPVALPVWAPRLRRARRVLRRRANKPPAPLTRWQLWFARRTVANAASSLGFAPIRDRDRVLVQLLDDAVSAVVRPPAGPAEPEPGAGTEADSRPPTADGGTGAGGYSGRSNT